jgi:hypothetical protein
MNEPYRVLDSGAFVMWGRKCSWTSRPRLVADVDPLVFTAVVAMTAAEWRDHTCGEGAGVAPVWSGEAGPAPSASVVEVA